MDIFGSQLELHTANPKESIVVIGDGAPVFRRGGRPHHMVGHEMMVAPPPRGRDQIRPPCRRALPSGGGKIRESLVAGEGPSWRSSVGADHDRSQLPEQQIHMARHDPSDIRPQMPGVRTRVRACTGSFWRRKGQARRRSLRSIIQRSRACNFLPGGVIVTLDYAPQFPAGRHPRGLILCGNGPPPGGDGQLRLIAKKFLRTRSPGIGRDAEQIRERTWWLGPRGGSWLATYDLVATTSGNPLMGDADSKLPGGRYRLRT